MPSSKSQSQHPTILPCRCCSQPVPVASPSQATAVLCDRCRAMQLDGSYATRPVMMAMVDKSGHFTIHLAVDQSEVEVQFFGFIGGWEGISARKFISDVKAAIGQATKLTLVVNSGGGDVFEATAIYSFLASLSQDVHVKVTGVAASAATLIAMAADSVSMAANAYWMVHGVRGGIFGTSQQIRDYLKLLDDANQNAKLTYQAKTSLSDLELERLLSKDSWLTAEEAHELGFIDAIDPITKVKPHVKPKAALKFQFDAAKFDRAFAEAEVQRLAACYRDDEGELDAASLSSPVPVLAAAGSVDRPDERGPSKEKGMSLAENLPAAPSAQPTVDLEAAATAARLRRQKAIIDKCGPTYADLAADAIEHGWDDQRLDVELRARKAEEALRQATGENDPGFGGAFNIHVKQGKPVDDAVVLSVALSLSAGVSVDDLLNPYEGLSRSRQLKLGINQPLQPASEKQIELAQKYFPGLGLQEVILHCNRIHKTDLSQTWRGDESIQASFMPPQAAFSTVTVPAILKDAVDRAVIAGYKKAEPKWDQFCSTEPVRDFKKLERFRVFGTGRWETVGADGELKHGQIGADPVYSIQIETEGQIMMISRPTIINNDVGQIMEIGESMAVYGRLGPEFAVFDMINKAYATATNTFAFTYEALEALWKSWILKTMYDTKDVKKDKGRALQAALDMEPAVVLVNKTRELDMKKILSSTLAVAGGGNTAQLIPTMNALEGSLRVVASSYFYRGGATPNRDVIAMMPGPSMVPAFKVAFLNGRQVPWIQQVSPEPDKLGYGIRGYLDFGVAQTESFLIATQDDVA
ncbi:MAG: Clp protease ClpP [Pirellulales bacterium]